MTYRQVEIITGPARRRRFSLEEKLRLVEEAFAPGIADEHRRPHRLEATLARIDELVAILNVVHDLDPAAVERTHGRVLDAYARRRGSRPVPGEPPGNEAGEGAP